VGGVDEFAGVGVFVLGGEAEQVARLRAAQVRVVDQQRTGDAVQAILQGHHLAQLRTRGGHLGGDFRRRFGHAADHCGAGSGAAGWMEGGAGGKQGACR
jgi:hypothetical protein